MADQQRIHPVPDADPERSPRPTAPLVPRGSFRSEKGDPEQPTPFPAPLRRTIPYSPSKPPKKRSCCGRCVCCTCCFLFFLIVAIAASAGILYLVFRPKIPKYSVDSLRITQLNLDNANSLSATFNVNITARNPNKKIGIYYEGGSNLSVFYAGTKLCEGSLPKFYQGHRNTTVLSVDLSGQTDNASGLMQSLQAQQQTGTIPLNLRVKVPVKLKVGKLKLMKWKFLVKCRVNVDSLRQDNVIRVRDSSCKFRFRL
ncbi:PREDICTED: NDR1/HIN1-Like protein 3-like [Ipomoea nil]|uniref:NDR1/HIN1-Like protein 3-like n=1 Tax=Ipomoea nil TaxID=35883 RepID=UPI000900BEAA|nr:PREDICTED: NDR1/HIN1-Like protein 3-like [Ipomoea nil]